MTFARANPSGWSDNSPVMPDEIDALDADHADAIDGGYGGAYTPSGQILLGGAGLKVLSTGAFRVDSLAEFYGSMMLGGSSGDAISVNGTPTFNAPAMINGALTVDGNVTLGNALTDTVAVGGTLTVNDDLVVNGDVALGSASSDSIDQNGILTSHAPITLSTNSGFRWRIATGTDASQTFHPANYDQIIVPVGTLSAGRTYTLGSSGALEGMRIEVLSYDVAHSLTIDSGSGTFSAKWPDVGEGSLLVGHAFYYRSGSWVPGEVFSAEA